MAKAAISEELRNGFKEHLAQTQAETLARSEVESFQVVNEFQITSAGKEVVGK